MKHGPPPRRQRGRAGRHRVQRPVRRHVRRRSHTGIVLVGAFALLGTGVAAAYWNAGGAGTGSAAAGTATPLTTVVATASASSLLYPGGPVADLTLTVRNPNPYPVSITGVSADGAVTASGGIGSCTTTGVSFTAPSAGLPFAVPARTGGTDGSATVVLTGAAQMSSASENGCQSAVFTVPVALTGTGG